MINNEDKDALNRFFDTSDPSKLLLDILSLTTEDISRELFFKYLHLENTYIKDKANLYLNSLSESYCPFQLIHGYSKNGKSTFVEYARYLNNQKTISKRKYRYIIIRYNFEKGGQKNYLDKVRLFVLDEFDFYDSDNFQRDCNEFQAFAKFYQAFVNKLRTRNDGDDDLEEYPTNPTTSYFDNFCDDIFYGINELTKDPDNLSKDLKLLKGLFRKKIIELTNNDNCGDTFSLLILFKIFKSRYKIFYNVTIQQKLVFLLDNLDDYLNNEDLLFFQQPQIQLSSLIHYLTLNAATSKYFSDALKESMELNENVVEWDFSISRHLNITYVFRTANFLVFSSLMRKTKRNVPSSGERVFPECMLNVDYLSYNSIKFSDNILRKRLDFTVDYLNVNNIQLILPRLSGQQVKT